MFDQGAPAAFAIFVYPFRHSLQLPTVGSGTRKSRLKRLLAERWDPWPDRLIRCDGISEKGIPSLFRDAFDASYYFVAAVREMLFPEFCRLDRVRELGNSLTIDSLRQWCESNYTELPKQRTLHLTLKADCLSPWRRARIVYTGHGDSFEARFAVEWVDLFLFPGDVGLLALKVTPELTDSGGHRGFADFIYHFRTILPLQPDWDLARLVPSEGAARLALDWVEELLSGAHEFGSRYAWSKSAQEQGERFFTFSYYSGAPISELPGDLADTGQFEPGEVAALEVASALPVEQPNLRCHAYLRQLLDRHKLAVWKDWTAVALRDGVAFVAHAGKAGPLARGVEHDYFYLYLYCLHQRIALLDLQDCVLMMEPDARRALRRLELLFDRFIQFRNRFWFVEVTRRPLGAGLYRTIQTGLDTREMYNAVGSEIQDLHTYYESRLSRRINGVVNLLAFVAFPLTFVVGFLGINLQGVTATTQEGLTVMQALSWCLLGLVVGAGAWMVVRQWRR